VKVAAVLWCLLPWVCVFMGWGMIGNAREVIKLAAIIFLVLWTPLHALYLIMFWPDLKKSLEDVQRSSPS
jgi:hypothetical protein